MFKEIVEKTCSTQSIEKSEFLTIFENKDSENDKYLFQKADEVRRKNYENDIYIRGLIEISNHCKNDCLYCGIRCSNRNLERYRLNEDEILECCEEGYNSGFRTFVLQGGEDLTFTDEKVCRIVEKIKSNFSDCAVTLSLGEKSKETYQKYFNAGADRYLLRHETASENHYKKLHPNSMSFENRVKCLENLIEIGFQTGAGMMVNSPYQTAENLFQDLIFMKKLNPHMVGIGAFIPHNNTPFKEFPQGTLRDTLVMISLTRLILPNALIPSTTALASIHPQGRELGFQAGANVIMPNLSPFRFRKLYSLYNNKVYTGNESAQELKKLEMSVKKIGYRISYSKGDYKD